MAGITQAQINRLRGTEEREIVNDLKMKARSTTFDPNESDDTDATRVSFSFEFFKSRSTSLLFNLMSV